VHASPFESAWSVVADAAGIDGATALLDLGCGDGGFCVFAAQRGATVHGLDAEPDVIALALARVPGGEFRMGLMEHLPWPDNAFDVLTSFNALQYALDPELALTEACRVARPQGRIAICKWGSPADNEFFAFLISLGANGVHGDRLPISDPVDDAIRTSRRELLATGDVPAPIQMADGGSLEAALSRAGIEADPVAATGETDVAAAAAPYRQADGSYRFGNRLRYWILAP
jgi:SAM-dependent methyltransferase